MFKPADVRGIGMFISSSCTLNFTVPLRLWCPALFKRRRDTASPMFVKQQINISHLYLNYLNRNHNDYSLDYKSLFKKKDVKSLVTIE